jgi:mRNA-degrading endonuclease RelE of RelBE toxin-antitoxin system
VWNVKLTPQAQRQLKGLEEDIRDDAVSYCSICKTAFFRPTKYNLKTMVRI